MKRRERTTQTDAEIGRLLAAAERLMDSQIWSDHLQMTVGTDRQSKIWFGNYIWFDWVQSPKHNDFQRHQTEKNSCSSHLRSWNQRSFLFLLKKSLKFSALINGDAVELIWRLATHKVSISQLTSKSWNRSKQEHTKSTSHLKEKLVMRY